jgi:SAM-dependent methyltransferase
MRLRPLLLGGTFFPNLQVNRIWDGDIGRVREYYTGNPSRVKTFLLSRRFDWISSHLTEGGLNVEIGSGSGIASFFLKKKLILTDVVKHEWIDRIVDATNMDFPEGSVDAFVLNHCLHHFSDPITFFRDAGRFLKLGGKIIIHDPHPSLLMRLLARLARHEGWSYECDPFARNPVCNDPADPWSANLALSELLFADRERFERELTGYRVVFDDFAECLIWVLSGGVNARAVDLDLPGWMIRIAHRMDQVLVRAPRLFALSRRIVLQRQ